jgi:transposase
MRYALTDKEWNTIQRVLPSKPRGIPRVNDQRVINCVLWILRSGAPWRDLPCWRRRLHPAGVDRIPPRLCLKGTHRPARPRSTMRVLQTLGHP